MKMKKKWSDYFQEIVVLRLSYLDLVGAAIMASGSGLLMYVIAVQSVVSKPFSTTATRTE